MGVTDLLRRGLAAGAAAGVAAAIVLYLFVEPVIRKALVIEEARGAEPAGGHKHSHAEPLVSRTLQVVGGMGTAVVVGCLFGIAFAVVFARTRHRLAAGSEHGRAAALAALAFLVFSLMPALAIPANPPAVGDPESVTRRTLIYVMAILVSLALVLTVFALDQAVAGGLSAAARSALAVLAFAVGAAVLLALLPGTPDAVPADVPASLIWEFRVASLGQLAAMWATLGLVFGVLVTPRERADRDVEAEVFAA